MVLPPQLRQAGGSGLWQKELQAGSLEKRETQGPLTSSSGSEGFCDLHKLPALGHS